MRAGVFILQNKQEETLILSEHLLDNVDPLLDKSRQLWHYLFWKSDYKKMNSDTIPKVLLKSDSQSKIQLNLGPLFGLQVRYLSFRINHQN